MNYSKFTNLQRSQAQSHSAAYDMGLRSYMMAIYQYMTIALGITGVVALSVSSSAMLLSLIFSTPLAYLFLFAPAFVAIYMSARFTQLSPQSVKICLFSYAALLGVSLSSLFMAYTGVSIARTFFITASTFGIMSIYGYSTKRDLSSLGSFMMMGVIGIMIATLVNVFLKSPAIQFIVSIVGVIVFVGLAAFDTQKLKDLYYQVSGDAESENKASLYGAFNLYIDFINIFLFLINFLGEQKKR